MKNLEYRWEDFKVQLPPGEWQQEPDKMQFTDEDTDLPCLIVRNGTGGLCGYIGVDKTHPYFEKHYSDINNISVHGGLTFCNFCVEDNKEEGICHVVEPGENDRVWWLGFDCVHSGDMSPLRNYFLCISGVYRNINYVKNEIKQLASQLKNLN